MKLSLARTSTLGFTLLALLHTGCAPGFLQKYSRQRSEVESSRGGSATPRTQRQSIFPVAEGTFRLQLPYDRVWDSMLDVLLRNYNLQIAEKSSGLVTTEWDSYYLDGKIHRNKVSLRMKRLAGQIVEMTIHNNVEVLSRLPDGGVTEVWLPSDRNKPEIGRIIQNIAIAMGQPKPKLPEEMAAQNTAVAPASEKVNF